MGDCGSFDYIHMIAHETPRPLTGRGTAARRCCCCCCSARCCRCSTSAPSERARSRLCSSRRRRARRARRDMSCVMFTLMSVHESPQPFAGRGTGARRCCRCCCSARACRCRSSARRESAHSRPSGGMGGSRPSPCAMCTFMFVHEAGSAARRRAVGLSLVAAAAAVAALLLLFCALLAAVIAAARGGASRLCPWRGGETLSLSVTLHEETEPSKGTAKRAHGLVRLALDISKA